MNISDLPYIARQIIVNHLNKNDLILLAELYKAYAIFLNNLHITGSVHINSISNIKWIVSCKYPDIQSYIENAYTSTTTLGRMDISKVFMRISEPIRLIVLINMCRSNDVRSLEWAFNIYKKIDKLILMDDASVKTIHLIIKGVSKKRLMDILIDDYADLFYDVKTHKIFIREIGVRNINREERMRLLRKACSHIGSIELLKFYIGTFNMNRNDVIKSIPSFSTILNDGGIDSLELSKWLVKTYDIKVSEKDCEDIIRLDGNGYFPDDFVEFVIFVLGDILLAHDIVCRVDARDCLMYIVTKFYI